jgi:hypothetical protein
MTKKQLTGELHALRKRISELESSEAGSRRALESCISSEKRLRLMADPLPVKWVSLFHIFEVIEDFSYGKIR